MNKLFSISIVIATLFIACKTDTKKQDTTPETATEMAEAITQKTSVLNDATHIADVTKSQILWKGFKPTGTHFGTLMLKNGEIQLAEGMLQQAYFEMDMNSIVCTDMPADDEYNQKLVNHLKNEDFFDASQFPSASFKLTNQATNNKGEVELTGDLTIKGITKSVTFPASLKSDGNAVSLKSEAFKINRTDYGIKYKSKNFFTDLKDKFIDDEFEVSFDVVLNTK